MNNFKGILADSDVWRCMKCMRWKNFLHALARLNEPLSGAFLPFPVVWRKMAAASDAVLHNLVRESGTAQLMGVPMGGGSLVSHMSLILNQVVQNLNLRRSLFQSPCFMLWERGCFDGAWGPGNPRHPQRWNPHTRACHCQVQNLIHP